MRKLLFVFILLLALPIGFSAAAYWSSGRSANWQSADRSSAGLLPAESDHPEAMVRVFAARTVRWRGIFAVHSWIVIKEQNAPRYVRYDYTAWGDPISVDRFQADGRWFGSVPDTVVAVDGEAASRLIPKIKAAISDYKYSEYGDYSAWPGPNSNTFVKAVLDSVPELGSTLPPTAIGKDYPYDGRWFGRTATQTGLFASLGGYLGLTVGWIEGIELNFFGAVLGLDVRRPAIKLPGIGRLGLPITG